MAVKWLSVAEAAQVLDVSESTVRRRIDRKMLLARKGEGHRREVQIPVPDEQADDVQRQTAEGLQEWASQEQENTRQPESESEVQVQNANPWVAAQQGEADPAAAVFDPPAYRPHMRLTPRALLKKNENEDDLTRYQRLAGASLMLAQQQADQASEQVAVARHQAYRLRRLCMISWAVTAAVLLLSVMTIAGMSYRVGQAHQKAELAQQAMDVLERTSPAVLRSASARLE